MKKKKPKTPLETKLKFLSKLNRKTELVNRHAPTIPQKKVYTRKKKNWKDE
jgi:hypothetical protein